MAPDRRRRRRGPSPSRTTRRGKARPAPRRGERRARDEAASAAGGPIADGLRSVRGPGVVATAAATSRAVGGTGTATAKARGSWRPRRRTSRAAGGSGYSPTAGTRRDSAGISSIATSTTVHAACRFAPARTREGGEGRRHDSPRPAQRPQRRVDQRFQHHPAHPAHDRPFRGRAFALSSGPARDGARARPPRVTCSFRPCPRGTARSSPRRSAFDDAPHSAVCGNALTAAAAAR